MIDRPFWWAEFGTDAFGEAAKNAVAVLPVAAIEQHGPHLPLGADAMIAKGLLGLLEQRLPSELDARVLPVQEVGKSDEHDYAPGTLHVPYAALCETWIALGRSVARAGIGRLVIVTSHGGNEEVIGIAARRLRVEHDMLVVRTAWSRFGTPEGLFDADELRHGIHGGDLETSLMLHFRPDLVAMERARRFASSVEAWEKRFAHLKATGPHAFSWIATDLNAAGVVGNAAAAAAEKGRRAAEHQVEGFIALLGDVASAPLPVPGRPAPLF